jgi:hypothetical protein
MCVPFGDRVFPNESSVVSRTADQPAIRVSASITGLFDVQGYRLGLNGKSETARPRQFFWGRDCAATDMPSVQQNMGPDSV